jgi:hypothetical protein
VAIVPFIDDPNDTGLFELSKFLHACDTYSDVRIMIRHIALEQEVEHSQQQQQATTVFVNSE